ncbi:MAG: hypothetical protein K2N48_01285 [Muribaculaceae bacterium]|nr:hypothetical protein [Muribaculaceae bacterium]
MPHSNGKIYSEVVNGEKIGINESDVASTIGVNSYDWVTLGTSEKNNKWSKKKPVRGESPADYPEPWDRNTGNVRGVVGYPIYWGLQMPFNTYQQCSLSVHQAWLKPLAIRAARLLSAAQCIGVKNYVYARPVAGTDCVRWTDYDGYDHKAPEPWTCGVQGAEAIAGSSDYTGSPGMLINVDSFDTSEVGFYIGMPSNASLSFKDLYDFGDYRFVVELYKYDDRLTDSATPVAVLVCMTPIKNMSFGATCSVTVKWLNAKFGFSGDSEHNIFAVTGVLRFASPPTLTELKRDNNTGLGCALLTNNSSIIGMGDGSIPPWTNNYKPFVCQIKLRSFSKLFVSALQYMSPPPASPTSYTDFPSTAVNHRSDGLRVKTSVKNNGTSSVTLNRNTTSSPRFQFQSHGSYDTTHASYSAMCDSPSDGKWHDVTLSPTETFPSSTPITIPSGATINVYMQCLGFLPIGRTSSITIRTSTDGGTTWAITGSFSAPFIVS